MSKIQKITVCNLKAISSLTANFQGMTAIITGGNDKGKTTFLRGLIDRIMGDKPEIILRHGTEEGFAECELTTGEIFKWSFDNKTRAGEKLIFITKDKIKTSLTRSIADRFFPSTFEVDKFLNDTPAKQRKTLQEVVGLDFSDIDERYQISFSSRTEKNRRYNEEKIKFDSIAVPEKTEKVDLSVLFSEKEELRAKLNKEYLLNKETNKKARAQWKKEFDQAQIDFDNAKRGMDEKNSKKERASLLAMEIHALGFIGSEIQDWIETLPYIKEVNRKEVPEPEYIQELPDDSEIKLIDEKINTANETNSKAEKFTKWEESKKLLSDYMQSANEADTLVRSIEKERMDLIKSAKMPEGFAFTDTGITYRGFEFNKKQLSSSCIYIAALKLASLTLGEVKTLHFDASFLDKNNLLEIEKWANDNDLQLLIERPDFLSGDIQYELISEIK